MKINVKTICITSLIITSLCGLISPLSFTGEAPHDLIGWIGAFAGLILVGSFGVIFVRWYKSQSVNYKRQKEIQKELKRQEMMKKMTIEYVKKHKDDFIDFE